MFDDSPRQQDLEQRLRSYHDVSLQRVLDELDYLREPGDRVFIGGSLAYGLGNALSDLDVLLVGPYPEKSSRLPLEHFVSSLRVDVWRLSFDAVAKAFRRARDALRSSASLWDTFGAIDDDFDLKLLTHTAFGIGLDGEELPVEGQEPREVASHLVIRKFVERMRGSALLAELALRSGSALAASAHARLAVEEGLVAMLAQRRLPFCGAKWIGERLSLHPDLARLYQAFRALPRDSSRTTARFVREAVGSSARMWGLDMTLEGLAPFSSWKYSGLELATVGDELLLVSTGSGVMWTLEREEADAWRRLTAGAEEAGEIGNWFTAPPDGDQLRLCNSLYERGVIELRWETGVLIKELAPMPEGSR